MHIYVNIYGECTTIKLIANMIHSDSSAYMACIRAYMVRHNVYNKAMVCTELNYTHCAFPNCSELEAAQHIVWTRVPFAIPCCYNPFVMSCDSINDEKIRREITRDEDHGEKIAPSFRSRLNVAIYTLRSVSHQTLVMISCNERFSSMYKNFQ